MLVTINTDASYHHIHKLGAYAFWIISNQGKIMKSGPLKQAMHSCDAESKCIANALYTILKSDWEGITRIIINTDSKNTIHAMTGIGRSKKVHQKIRSILNEIKSRHNITNKKFFEFRHVKAHTGTDEGRKWVNDWCDKMAKKQLKKMIG